MFVSLFELEDRELFGVLKEHNSNTVPLQTRHSIRPIRIGGTTIVDRIRAPVRPRSGTDAK